MRKRLRACKKWLCGLLLALLWLQVAAVGVAAETQATHIELSLPQKGKAGEEVAVTVTLAQAGGSPIEGVEVVFSTKAKFANVSGEVELGRAVTDDQGMASWAYLPRSSGEQTIVARFLGNAQYGPTESWATISIEPGPQLYNEEAGVHVPGIGVWLLTAGLGIVWIIFLVVIVLLGFIAEGGPARFSYLG